MAILLYVNVEMFGGIWLPPPVENDPYVGNSRSRAPWELRKPPPVEITGRTPAVEIAGLTTDDESPIN
jgi:hypothetical protein